ERGQPWGRRAKRALLEMVGGRGVEVSWQFTDRYGRRVGHVHCEGRDINRELVREGHAWVYRQWMRDRTLLDDEAHARAARAGLWRTRTGTSIASRTDAKSRSREISAARTWGGTTIIAASVDSRSSSDTRRRHARTKRRAAATLVGRSAVHSSGAFSRKPGPIS